MSIFRLRLTATYCFKFRLSFIYIALLFHQLQMKCIISTKNECTKLRHITVYYLDCPVNKPHRLLTKFNVYVINFVAVLCGIPRLIGF